MWLIIAQQVIEQQPLVRVGPMVLTGEVSLPSLVSAVAIVVAAWKLVWHLQKVNDQVTQLWKAIMGEGLNDTTSLSARFNVMEYRVGEIWRRLKFDKLSGGAARGDSE